MPLGAGSGSPLVRFYVSGTQAGLGHLSRSSTLARVVTSQCRVEVVVLGDSCSKQGLDLLEGLPTRQLSTTVGHEDLAVLDVADRTAAEKLLEGLKQQGIRRAAIVDSEPLSDAELNICPGPQREDVTRSKGSNEPILYGGVRYALVDDAFVNQDFENRDGQVVVALGGTVQCVDVLPLAEQLGSHIGGVVLIAPDAPEATGHGLVKIESRLSRREVASRFRAARLIVTSAGVSSYEALATGAPVAIVALDGRQTKIAQTFEAMHVARFLGPWSRGRLDAIVSATIELVANEQVRRWMSNGARKLDVQGGKHRAAQLLESMIS